MKQCSIASILAISSVIGGCTSKATKPALEKPAPAIAQAKPEVITVVRPARYTLMDWVGTVIDEATESAPSPGPTPILVNGKRLIVQDGLITQTAEFPEKLTGFRSLPARLGGGYVVWSDEHTYHTPTFLGKLTPFVKIGARGGVRPWFDSFVLRTNIGALEVNPKNFTVRRTELARFSEMLSMDGQVGVRTDSFGRLEASVDGGISFRKLEPAELGNYVGPTVGPDNKLVFRREAGEMRPGSITTEMRTLAPSGKLIPFEPKPNEPLVLAPASLSPEREESAQSTLLAASEMRIAIVAGALVPGERALYVQESNIRVLSAKSGQFIHNIPLTLGVPDFGNCQAITLGDEVFLACIHPTGAHLFSLRGTPSAVQLEATFPEPGEFVGGLGRRFLFTGRCGSTPPTVRDFHGYTPSQGNETAAEGDPSAGSAEPPPVPDDPDKPSSTDFSVCVRVKDGSWIERHIEGLPDRKKARFLPGDDGNVTVVYFDKQGSDTPTPKPTEGVRFIRVDSPTTKFNARELIVPIEGSERQLRLVNRNLWLDEKNGSVHGWIIAPRKAKTDDEKDSENEGKSGDSEEGSEEPSEESTSEEADIEWYMQTKFVGVQINPDGTIVKHPLPEGADLVVVGGPYAIARIDDFQGQQYLESTDGGRTYTPVAGPVASNLVEGIGGEIEGCSILGCAIRGGLLRLGWGSATNPESTSAVPKTDPVDVQALSSKVFDPAKLLPPKAKQQLICRLNAKESSAEAAKPEALPVTLPMLRNAELGTPVDQKWSTLATLPFELKLPHRVEFEDVKVSSAQGLLVPVLRATAATPVGIFLRANEGFRFDLSPGAKRKPTAFSSDVRGDAAAEIDRDSLVMFDSRSGDLQLVKGSTVRPLFRVLQIPDVYHSSVLLARKAGVGSDKLGILLWQAGSGDMLLGDVDLGRSAVGPLRYVGNYEDRRFSTSCPVSDQDYRVVLNEPVQLEFDPAEEGRSGLKATSLVSVGPKGICVEASEVHLVDETTVVIRYSGSATAGHPALLHKQGKSLPATCTYE